MFPIIKKQSFRILALLSLSFALFSRAETTEFTSRRLDNQQFVILPMDAAKKITCEKQPLIKIIEDIPKQFHKGQYLWVSPDSPNFARAASMGNSEDDSELTCYRCSFKKIEKDECGRYAEIHGHPEFAADCPKIGHKIPKK